MLDQLALIPAMKKRLLEVIAIEKPDVLHAHSPALNGMAALLAGRETGLPVVYEVRAFWEDAAVDHGTCREGDLRYQFDQSAGNLCAASRQCGDHYLRRVAAGYAQSWYPKR